MKKRTLGFTLIELLVVIAIISILAALLVPAVQTALDKGRQVHCTSNLHNMAVAFHSFAADHGGHLPGSAAHGTGTEEWQAPWVGVEIIPENAAVTSFPDWPHRRLGSVAHYYFDIGAGATSGNARAFRCPSLAVGDLLSGVGSNGMFDYSMWKALGGALTENIPATAIAFFRTPFHQEVQFPMIVEEDPLYGLNNRNVDPGHANTDRIGSWHNDGVGQYASLAGGVSQVRQAQAKYNATTWYATTPSGTFQTIGVHTLNFGEWNSY